MAAEEDEVEVMEVEEIPMAAAVEVVVTTGVEDGAEDTVEIAIGSGIEIEVQSLFRKDKN